MSKRHELQRHLHSLTEIRGILNAMKNLSLMEIHKLSRLLSSQRRVVAGMRAVAADFFTFHPDLLPDLGPRVYLVIGSERGFCGDFNEAVLRALDEERRTAPAPAWVIGVGRKIAEKLAHLGDGLVARLAGPSVTEEIQPVLIRLMDALRDLQAKQDPRRPMDLTVLAHAQEEEGARLLVRQPFRQLGRDAARHPSAPVLNLEPLAFLTGLMHEYLFAVLHEIFYSSLMAENRRRFQHMDHALQRLEKQTADLALKHQALRQEEITQEIAVILLGVEAMGGPGSA